jgi:hypothetical protein
MSSDGPASRAEREAVGVQMQRLTDEVAEILASPGEAQAALTRLALAGRKSCRLRPRLRFQTAPLGELQTQALEMEWTAE